MCYEFESDYVVRRAEEARQAIKRAAEERKRAEDERRAKEQKPKAPTDADPVPV